MANHNPMKTRLKEAFNYLETKKSLKQKDVARLMGTSETTISRNIASAGDGRINTDFLIKLNESVGNTFNIQYIIDGTGSLFAAPSTPIDEERKINETMQAASLIDLSASLIKEVESLRLQLTKEIEETRALRTQLTSVLSSLHRHPGVEYSINHNYGYPAAVAEETTPETREKMPSVSPKNHK